MSERHLVVRAALVGLLAAPLGGGAPGDALAETKINAPAVKASGPAKAHAPGGAAHGGSKAHAPKGGAAADDRPGAGSDDGGAADPQPTTTAAPPASKAWSSCTEHVPPGAARPALKEHFPDRGTSGYASVLEIAIDHGKGETVLPQGFAFQGNSEAARALGDAGFLFPDPDGGAGPNLATTATGAGATTTISLPVLVLPKAPGRNAMTLPPLPIAVARASGELVTLCTEPHDIVVDDPTSSTPDAWPRANPPGRSQVEEWTLAKQLTIGALIGAALAAVLAWLVARWMRRPRPLAPPPPPRPPWDVALEELFAIRHAGLLEEARFAEHYDRVSDAVRKYLGGRYGFDGLETTTPEMTSLLRRIEPPVVDLPAILGFLDECDLVKFARFTPSDEDCARVLEQGEHIVVATTPRDLPPGAAAASRRPASPGVAR